MQAYRKGTVIKPWPFLLHGLNVKNRFSCLTARKSIAMYAKIYNVLMCVLLYTPKCHLFMFCAMHLVAFVALSAICRLFTCNTIMVQMRNVTVSSFTNSLKKRCSSKWDSDHETILCTLLNLIYCRPNGCNLLKQPRLLNWKHSLTNPQLPCITLSYKLTH